MPADEANAELVSCLGLVDELLLVDAEPAQEPDERWHGGFADTYGAEILGLDELDLAYVRSKVMAQHRRGEPPGRAATDDYHF